MDNRDAAPTEPATWPVINGRTATSPATWRLRVRMDDRPGALARLAIRLADLDCNVLGLSVIPLADGVLDEIVVRPPAGLTGSDLVAALRAEGCDCDSVAEADVRDLVDPATATLQSAARAINEPAKWADVMREVLAADLVTVVPVSEANPARTEGGHRAVLTVGTKAVVLRRQWAAFTDIELSRARALLALLSAAEANITAPSVISCDDGASIVLRGGRPSDSAAVSDLHARCSSETLFQRYHTGLRTLPRRWLHRLLLPPRGISVLGICGRDVVALGQLIASSTPGTAEVSLLVEDSWQNNGLGSALLARLSVIAAIRGYDTIFALCPPAEERVIRTARRAGLEAVSSEYGTRQMITMRTRARLGALRTDGNTLTV